MNDLLALAIVFLKVGLLAFGGSTGVLPELQRQIVHEQGWLDAAGVRGQLRARAVDAARPC